ncbi:MAG: hypothetical protein CM15mP125_3750 [Gammaproteobacteria bacterium]|nr:MAG: hypothetical protein CM15mP125_3750 [Gammaproteobacteria bacterium]
MRTYYLHVDASMLSGAAGHSLGIKLPHTARRPASRDCPQEVYQGLFKFAFVRNPWDLR